MKNWPNLFCHCQTGYFAVAIDACFELLISKSAANQVPDWHLIVQLQAGVPQNQVAALFGVSPSTLSRLKATFHITGDVKDRPRSGRPKKTTPQEDHFITLSALSLLQICSQGLQDDMADGSLPRQSGTDYTQPISGLIGLPGVLP